jgi:uncharacterized protein (TIGR03086 family)
MAGNSPMVSLGPAAEQVKDLLSRVPDEHLHAATPCGGMNVGALLDHFMGLTIAFTNAAHKVTDGFGSGAPPQPAAEHLDPEWRHKLPEQLDGLVAAWKDPSAWRGEARAGGVTLPAEVMGVVALDELVIHGWDLSRATGQVFEADQTSLDAIVAMLSQFPDEARGAGAGFGPVVEVGPDAPLLARAIGLSGRDPAWTP